MLHLAQVQKTSQSDEITLQLLAKQTVEKNWVIADSQAITVSLDTIPNVPLAIPNTGVLVLVDLDDGRNVLRLEEATEWVLTLVEQLANSPEKMESWLKEEAEKIEKWRQELTLKSQEMSMKTLELETRREQFEKTMAEEQAELERRRGEFKKEGNG
ncbi:hypothetical protein PN462_17385 [Spirulina sp. CS-785/01]|uniref:hypothetical protein n=1 Tax=Spirulina sp. CS-785/01 TaxID=3021716 RepID=UPI00232D2B27|nr:hypothetical protein [Spirulina sp. CS-785/01]MDB9314891.1 hypothetical protein [Spirulina sp. CS-785/01]